MSDILTDHDPADETPAWGKALDELSKSDKSFADVFREAFHPADEAQPVTYSTRQNYELDEIERLNVLLTEAIDELTHRRDNFEIMTKRLIETENENKALDAQLSAATSHLHATQTGQGDAIQGNMGKSVSDFTPVCLHRFDYFPARNVWLVFRCAYCGKAFEPDEICEMLNNGGVR